MNRGGACQGEAKGAQAPSHNPYSIETEKVIRNNSDCLAKINVHVKKCNKRKQKNSFRAVPAEKHSGVGFFT